MIDQLTPAQTVCNDSLLLSRILNFVRHDYLRQCRGVTKRWRYLIDKILRINTRVCVNDLNVETLLASNTVLGLSLHVRWSPILVTLPLKQVLQKYCRYIETLSWFMDNSGMSLVNQQEGQNQNQVAHLEMASLSFPCLKEIYFLISSARTEYYQLMLIDVLLDMCPELESIRLEISDSNFNTYKVINCIVEKKLANLQNLHFGEFVQLSPVELRLLTRLKLKSFSWEGNNVLPNSIDTESMTAAATTCDDALFSVKFFKSLDTLRIHGLRKHYIPAYQFPLRCLFLLHLNLVTIIPLSSQFPMLEELGFSFDPQEFNWEQWVPKDMARHSSIKSLQWLDKQQSFSASAMKCFLRLFEKLPLLEKLSCPVTCDKFMEQIILKVPHLKKLELFGNCTDYAITGIPNMYCSFIDDLLESGHLKKTQSVLKPYRQLHNICDLHCLEELTLFHTRITDEAVMLAISLCLCLKKVYITGISLTAILELVKLPKIREIGVPQPLEGTIQFGDIMYLKETNPHIRIIAGWDSKDFPRR